MPSLVPDSGTLDFATTTGTVVGAMPGRGLGVIGALSTDVGAGGMGAGAGGDVGGELELLGNTGLGARFTSAAWGLADARLSEAGAGAGVSGACGAIDSG